MPAKWIAEEAERIANEIKNRPVPTAAEIAEATRKSELRDKEIKEDRNRDEQDRINRWVLEAGVSLMHKNCSFENYIAETEEQKRIIERLKTDKKWFLFLGNTGTGKNHLAAAMIRERAKNNKGAVIWRVKKLIDELLGASLEEKRDMLRDLYEVDLLILNELGRSTDKKFFQDTFFDIMDERHENYKQTVIISNLSKEEVYGMFDEALQRKISESATVMQFNWQAHKGGAK
jgi:DNA replication protein DnaC